MSLHLTPHILAAAYEYLQKTRPFRAWKLPPADEVEFGVTRHRDREGDHGTDARTDGHIIRASEQYIKTTDDLMQLMAHEMIHAKQHHTKTAPRNYDHNAEFKRLAARVCKEHGWVNVQKFSR